MRALSARMIILTAAALCGTAPVSAQGPTATAQGPAAAAPATRVQPAAPEAGEPRICRRTQETGSLARRRRQCFTQAEWDRLAASGRSITQGIQDSGNGTLNALNN